MIHIQVAQNHDISIPQLIKKANEIEKKLYPISPRIIYDAKMTFLKNSFTAYNTTKKD